MPTALDSFTPSTAPLTWRNGLAKFLLHQEAVHARKTVRYYDVQLRQLIAWAEQNGVSFTAFRKSDLDQYLVTRKRAGSSQTTLHHDAVCAKAFFRWCVRYDLMERSPLAEYEVRRAPRPPKHMPTDEEMKALLIGLHEYWNVEKNPNARFQPPTKRMFHRDRNYALILGLLDTACRIGEMLSFQVDDYQAERRQITIRESKGREPRVLPVSQEWGDALTVWLRIRKNVMSTVPPNEDEGWLFISETGTRLDERRFLRALKNCLKWSGLTSNITLHSLRRYSLNRLAKTNLLAAQTIAGHKETKTTLIYTRLDPEFVRGVHESVGVVRNIVENRRLKKKRLV